MTFTIGETRKNETKRAPQHTATQNKSKMSEKSVNSCKRLPSIGVLKSTWTLFWDHFSMGQMEPLLGKTFQNVPKWGSLNRKVLYYYL